MVAFSSGHGDTEAHTWVPTLHKMPHMGKPAVFTAYVCQKAIKEAHVLERLGPNFTLHPKENRWRPLLLVPTILRADMRLFITIPGGI